MSILWDWGFMRSKFPFLLEIVKVNLTQVEVDYFQTGAVLHSSFCHRINQPHATNSSGKSKMIFIWSSSWLWQVKAGKNSLQTTSSISSSLAFVLGMDLKTYSSSHLYSVDESPMRLGNSGFLTVLVTPQPNDQASPEQMIEWKRECQWQLQD